MTEEWRENCGKEWKDFRVIGHPNVVHIRDVFVRKDGFIINMSDYYEGGDLNKIITGRR